jgi:hypothetical protein
MTVTNFNSAAPSSANSHDLNYNTSTVAGSTLLALIRCGQSVSVTCALAGAGTAFTAIGPIDNGLGRQYIFYLQNGPGGTQTARFSYSTSTTPQIAVAEITDATASSFDVSASNTGSASALTGGATATTAQGDEEWIGLFSISANQTFSQSGSWSIVGVQPAAGSSRVALVHQTASSTGTPNAAVTGNNSAAFIGQTATFRITSSGASGSAALTATASLATDTAVATGSVPSAAASLTNAVSLLVDGVLAATAAGINDVAIAGVSTLSGSASMLATAGTTSLPSATATLATGSGVGALAALSATSAATAADSVLCTAALAASATIVAQATIPAFTSGLIATLYPQATNSYTFTVTGTASAQLTATASLLPTAARTARISWILLETPPPGIFPNLLATAAITTVSEVSTGATASAGAGFSAQSAASVSGAAFSAATSITESHRITATAAISATATVETAQPSGNPPQFRAQTLIDHASTAAVTHDIAIPVGSVAGDLALLFVYAGFNPRLVSTVGHVDGSSLWDLATTPNPVIDSRNTSHQNVFGYSRIMDAGDIAAGVFRITMDGSVECTAALDVYQAGSFNALRVINNSATTTGSTTNTPTAPALTPTVANTLLIWVATDWQGGRQISPPTAIPTGAVGPWNLRSHTIVSSGAPLTVADIGLSTPGLSTGPTAGSETGAQDFWTASSILVEAFAIVAALTGTGGMNMSPAVAATATLSATATVAATGNPGAALSALASMTARAAVGPPAMPFSATASMVASQILTVTTTVNGASQFAAMEGFGVNVNPQNMDFSNVFPAVDLFINELACTQWHVDPFGNTNWIPLAVNLNTTFYNQIYSGARFMDTWNLLAYLYRRLPPDNVLLACTGLVSPFISTNNDGLNIDTSQETNFATMITSMVDYGRRVMRLPIRQIIPINESDLGNPEGPLVGFAQYIRIVDAIIGQLNALGYTDVQIVPPALGDATNAQQWYAQFIADSTAMSRIQHFTQHSYLTPPVLGNGLIPIQGSPVYNDRTIWISEWSQMVTDGNLDNGNPVVDEWLFARQDTDNLLTLMVAGGTATQGPTAFAHWDGWDNISVHHPHWTYWGMIAYSAPGYPNPGTNGTYTAKKRFYSSGQVFRFVPRGWRRIAATSNDPNTTILAFTNNVGGLTVTGHNRNTFPITLSCAHSSITNPPTSVWGFLTNQTLNMQSQGLINTAGNSFSFQVPADTFYTFSTVFTAAPALLSATATLTASASQIQASLSANASIVANFNVSTGSVMSATSGFSAVGRPVATADLSAAATITTSVVGTGFSTLSATTLTSGAGAVAASAALSATTLIVAAGRPSVPTSNTATSSSTTAQGVAGRAALSATAIIVPLGLGNNAGTSTLPATALITTGIITLQVAQQSPTVAAIATTQVVTATAALSATATITSTQAAQATAALAAVAGSFAFIGFVASASLTATADITLVDGPTTSATLSAATTIATAIGFLQSASLSAAASLQSSSAVSATTAPGSLGSMTTAQTVGVPQQNVTLGLIASVQGVASGATAQATATVNPLPTNTSSASASLSSASDMTSAATVRAPATLAALTAIVNSTTVEAVGGASLSSVTALAAAGTIISATVELSAISTLAASAIGATSAALIGGAFLDTDEATVSATATLSATSVFSASGGGAASSAVLSASTFTLGGGNATVRALLVASTVTTGTGGPTGRASLAASLSFGASAEFISANLVAFGGMFALPVGREAGQAELLAVATIDAIGREPITVEAPLIATATIHTATSASFPRWGEARRAKAVN